MEEVLSLKWENHSSTLLQILGKIRQKQMFSDVILACSGKFYNAHKFVLTACSDYFEDILHQTDCKKPVIILNGICNEELEALLDYMYMGEISIQQAALPSLIKAAEELMIKGFSLAESSLPSERIHDCPTEVFSNSGLKRKRKMNKDNSADTSGLAKHFKKENRPKCKDDSSVRESAQSPLDIGEGFVEVKIEEDPLDVPPLDNSIYLNNDCDVNTNKNLKNISKSRHSSNLKDADKPNWRTTLLPSGRSLQASTAQEKNRCPYCFKLNSSNSSLQIHLRIHTGEKPFSCLYCDYQSNVKSNLRRHLCMHHPLEVDHSVSQ